MKVTVLYFASARERAGCERESVELAGGADVRALAAHLETLHPRLSGALAHVRFAVNQGFVAPHHALADGDEVAVIPPVSGGAR